MAWHVASRSSWSTFGALSNELKAPLDIEYARNGHHSWWQPDQRLGNLSDPRRPTTTQPPTLKLPQLQTYAQPVYPKPHTGPILREHIYMTRPFRIERVPPGQMSGSVPLSSLAHNNPRLALERGLQRPHTPIYDKSAYGSTFSVSNGGVAFFGQPH